VARLSYGVIPWRSQRGAQGARPPKLSNFFAINVQIYCSIKCTDVIF